MRLGIIGIREEEAINHIYLNLRIKWSDLDICFPKSQADFRDLEVVVVGDGQGPLANQVREVRGMWGGALIAFSSQVNDAELVAVLGENADDYLSFTASGPEIVSRVSAAIRRTQPAEAKNDSAAAGSIHISLDTFEAYLGDQPIYLTPTEFRLLYHLTRNKGGVMSHEALQDLTWGSEGSYYRGALRKYVQRLRSKLSSGPSTIAIISVPRVGYRLEESGHAAQVLK